MEHKLGVIFFQIISSSHQTAFFFGMPRFIIRPFATVDPCHVAFVIHYQPFANIVAKKISSIRSSTGEQKDILLVVMSTKYDINTVCLGYIFAALRRGWVRERGLANSISYKWYSV